MGWMPAFTVVEWSAIIAAAAVLVGVLTWQFPRAPKISKPKLKSITHTPDSALTGRKSELKAIKKHFSFSSKPLVIHGGAGVGKTVLARQHAHSHYQGRWVMLPLGSDSEMKTAIEPIAAQLLIKDDGNIEAFIRKTMEAMQKAKSRWLIILDNADSDDEAERARKYALDTNDLDFLITSQRGKWPDTIKPYPLGVLSPDDAVTLLSKLSGRAIDKNLKHLAKELDYLPLALTLVGTDLGIQPTTTSLSDYQDTLVDLLNKVPDNTRYKKSMGMAVRLAFERLGSEAKALLNIAAFMDANDISVEFFVRGAEGIKEKGLDPLPEPLWPILQDKIKINRVLMEAETHSLLYPSSWQDEPTHRIHRTTQMVLRDMLADRAGEIAGFAARLGRAQVSGSAQYDTQNWPYYHRLAPHAEALAYFAESAEGDSGSCMAVLINSMGVFLKFATEDLNRVIRLEKGVLAIDKRLYGKTSSAYAVALSNFADTKSRLALTFKGATRKTMEGEAEIAHKKAIEIKSDMSDSELSLAYTYNNLGNFYLARNRFSDTETTWKVALKLLQDHGAEAHLIAASLGNMGSLYGGWALEETDSEKSEDYREKALKFKTRALDLTRIALGEIHQETAMSANNLSVEYYNIGKFVMDLNYAIRAAAILTLMVDSRQMSPTNPNITIYEKSLKSSLSALGQSPAEASALIEAAKPEIIAQHEKWEAAKAAGEDYDPPPITLPELPA